MINTSTMELLLEQFKSKKPYVIYSLPNSTEITTILQEDDAYYNPEDFYERAFVFCPFSEEAKRYCIPKEHAKVIKQDITFQEQKLDEVVVTALGITRAEKKLGYATQEMDVETIEEIKAPNVGSLFTGQVAGLSVTNPTGLFQSPSFSLRGKSPLIVIDGIPVDTDFFDLSSNDIGNVNVLKGTTASALYGSRGRNGAILITTKNAKNEGLEVSVSHNMMATAGFTVFPETQTEYGNGSNGKYEFWDGKDGGISGPL